MFENRGFMAARKCLLTTLWLTTSLTLLGLVLVAPLRTSGFATVSDRPGCLRRNFAISPGQPATRLCEEIAVHATLEVTGPSSENGSALSSETEEQERDLADALVDPRDAFLPPLSFRKIPALRLVSPRPLLSPFPLRC